jgi:hypothetical protein
MNDFRHMTEEQLLALDYDQKQLIIDLECAQQGLPLLPDAPGPKPEVTAIKEDSCVYDVAGVAVLVMEEAHEILAFLAKFPLVQRQYSGPSYYINPLESDNYNYPKVAKIPTFTKTFLEQSKDLIKRNTQILAEWEKQEKEYKNAIADRKSIISELEDLIESARDSYYKREQLRSKFQRYLSLAKGDREVAVNFLKAVESLFDFPELETEFLTPPEAEV